MIKVALKLDIETRNIFGKKLKKAREAGKMPAVFYGRGKETTPFFVEAKSFKKIWKEAGESSIVELEKDRKKFADVLIHDASFDTLKSEPIHADFYAVEMDKAIRVKVPLVFEGVAPAEKNLGGIIVKVMHEIEVEALPKDLPHELKVDISALATIGSQIAVKDIAASAGVKFIAKPEEIIILAEEHKEEIVEPTMTIADIEISEKKGKKIEEGEIAEGGVGATATMPARQEKKEAKK